MKFRKLLFIIGFSVLISSVTYPIYRSIGHEVKTFFIPALVFFTVAVNLVPKRFLKVFFAILFVVSVSYLTFHKKDINLLDWSLTFMTLLLAQLKALISFQLNLIPQEFGYMLVVIGLTILTILSSNNKKYWKLTFVVLLCYFIIINLFQKIAFHEALLQLFLGFCLLSYSDALYDQTDHVLSKKIALIVMSIALLISTKNYYSVYKVPYTSLINLTAPVRIKLSEMNFYSHFNLNRSNGMASRSGYSENSSVLGGPLYLNHSEVFKVKQDRNTYWSMESLYMYTGKGWDSNKEPIVYGISEEAITLPFAEIRQGTRNQHEILNIYISMKHLPTPLGAVSFNHKNNFKGKIIASQLDLSRSIQTLDIDSLTILDSDIPYLNFESVDLRKNTDLLIDSDDETSSKILDSKIYNNSKIPVRVTQLAREITQDVSTNYEKAKLIETYLKENTDFKYALSDVPYVPNGEDFVEHFLFASKIGYCEHFSSAMVVMLHSLGIPARWTKGYSSGTNHGNSIIYTNANAHAWPEVYFEGYGWIPFEPTPGFSIENQNNGDSPAQTPESIQPVTPPTTNGSSQTVIVSPSGDSRNPQAAIVNHNMLTYSIYIGILILILLWSFRVKLKQLLTIQLFKKSQDKPFIESFKQFDRVCQFYIRRDENTSVADYYLSITTLNMSHILSKYHEVIFGTYPSSITTEEDYQAMQTVISELRKGLKKGMH